MMRLLIVIEWKWCGVDFLILKIWKKKTFLWRRDHMFPKKQSRKDELHVFDLLLNIHFIRSYGAHGTHGAFHIHMHRPHPKQKLSRDIYAHTLLIRSGERSHAMRIVSWHNDGVYSVCIYIRTLNRQCTQRAVVVGLALRARAKEMEALAREPKREIEFK